MSLAPQQLVAGASQVGKLCSICQCSIVADEPLVLCAGCQSPFHDPCWAENGGCATYGCECMPETVSNSDPDAPASFWGQEHKQCPRCNRQIRVAARRCRHCGEQFDSQTPQSRKEYRASKRLALEVGTASTAAWAIFVAGMIPFLAPPTLLIGGAWVLTNRRLIQRLPPTQRVLCFVGLLAAGLTTAGLLIVFATYP